MPKYQLTLGDETVFSKSVSTFRESFLRDHFLFLVREDYQAREFVTSEVSRLKIQDYRVKVFNCDTRGQAESVLLGTRDYSSNEPIMIFNIDTIRINFTWPDDFEDGFIEVFEAAGEQWSFIQPQDSHFVARTAEKQRISNLCSSGLYGFAKLSLFRDAYEHTSWIQWKEQFVAPVFNWLIEQGHKINYRVVDADDVLHCGLPVDYEQCKLRLEGKP